MADELIDIVNKDGKVLRQAMKQQAHEKGWLHKTVIGYLRVGDSWTLVMQAPDRQDAGQLVAPVGGHTQAGESELDALIRESKEELGVKITEHKLIGKAIFDRHVIGRHENHLFVVYEISTNETIVLNHEAVSTETFTSDELKTALVTKPEDFGDAFYFVLEKFYRDFLPKGWQDLFE